MKHDGIEVLGRN